MIYNDTLQNDLTTTLIHGESANATSASNFENCSVLIYSGTQPSLADFIADFDTYYFTDISLGSSGANLLAYYGHANGTESTAFNVNLSYSANEIFLNNSTFTSAYVNSGTASWAVIYASGDLDPIYDNISNADNNPFMIVPVSDAAGNGVVKLSTTTVSDPVPTLVDINLTLTI